MLIDQGRCTIFDEQARIGDARKRVTTYDIKRKIVTVSETKTMRIIIFKFQLMKPKGVP